MTRYAKKVDGNHAEIRDNLRAIPGVYVQDVAAAAGLGFDLIVRYQDAPPVFMELKAGPKEPLTDSERRASKRFAGYWYRVESFEAALAVLGISADKAPF